MRNLLFVFFNLLLFILVDQPKYLKANTQWLDQKEEGWGSLGQPGGGTSYVSTSPENLFFIIFMTCHKKVYWGLYIILLTVVSKAFWLKYMFLFSFYMSKIILNPCL